MHLMNKLTLAVCACIGSTAYAASIENPGFEDKWDGWENVKSAAISTSDTKSGSRAAKTTGSKGYFSQEVKVDKNTTYQLSAYVLDKGKVGAKNDSGTFSVTTSSVKGDSDEWKKLTVEFNSGSDSTVTIYGDYEDGKGRFDNFSLVEVGSTEESDDDNDDDDDDNNDNDNANCSVVQIEIASAYDDGSNDGHYPSATIDGDDNSSSRWSSEGEGKTINYRLGAEVSIETLELAWFKSDDRESYFDVEVSTDNSSWSTVLSNEESQDTDDFSEYDLDGVTASYLRIIGQGNSDNEWNSLIETQIHGCIIGEAQEPETPIEEPEAPAEEVEEVEEPEAPVVIGDLDPKAAPSSNFDLTSWYLSVPSDEDDNGKADEVKENELNDDYEHSEYFYTANDGGMVFKCPIDGYKTSKNTTYTRTELRGMLRSGDTSISTSGVNENNWVLSTAPDKNDAGGYNGVLTATLAVNYVTTTGDDDQVGRVIVGQIHANDDEPLRIYYRKLPNHSKGSIYFAHEPANGNKEQWYELIGSRSDDANNPSDGIALNEKFSYVVDVKDENMVITIKRDGKPDVVSQVVDMGDSGYSDGGQYMYFKAGVYNQNKSGDDDDYVQATFYSLDNSHTNWK